MRTEDQIRVLAADMISTANSGHPGVALGGSDILYALYKDHVTASPLDSNWLGRDRFILACGHGSSMLYATLHLLGYDVTIDDLKQFRKLGSRTPGHPEYGHTDGIDATSGPLGQGIAMGVGMAIAESYLRHKYNTSEFNLFDYNTYVMCGDGDLQEGVTVEAMSLAGHLGLNKLIVCYDSNDIQLDGPVALANSEFTRMKFEAMGWNYILVEDGNDAKEVSAAITVAKGSTDKPTIIECKTKIGYKSPLEGTSACHGAPLKPEYLAEFKKNLGWELAPFEVAPEAYEDFKETRDRNDAKLNKWNEMLEEYQAKYPEKYDELMTNYTLDEIELYEVDPNCKEATRATSGKIIAEYSTMLTDLIGGSADLTASTKAKGADGDFTKQNRSGRNINYGVREHAMGAIANGITLSGLKTFTGGFFVFCDYMKPAMRMAALMNIPTTFVFSHDSICVGEDGPTHQPIEQLTMVRSIPNMNVIRPCNASETAQAWKIAMESKTTPTTILTSRQDLQNFAVAEGMVEKGAYVVSKEDDNDELSFVLIASGSEVNLALEVKEALNEDYNIRVVSMPSTNLFDKQSSEYQEEVLGDAPRFVIEMASSDLMYKYADFVYDIQEFGASGAMNDVVKAYGFTKEHIIESILEVLGE